MTRREWLAAAAVALSFASIAIAPSFVANGFLLWQMDGGIFAYVAQQWLDGVKIYDEVFDHKPPMIFVANAIGLWLSAGKPWGLAVMPTISAALFSALFLWTTRRYAWFARITALAAVFLWLVKLEAMNSIGVYTLALHLAVLALITGDAIRDRPGRAAFVAGVVTAMIGMFRPNQVLTGMIYLGYAVFRSSGRRSLVISSFGAGSIFCLAAILTPVMMRGSIGGFWTAAIEFNLLYAMGGSITYKLIFPLFGFANVGETGLLLVPFAVGAWALAERGRTEGIERAAVAAAVVLAAELVSGAAAGRLYSHYLTPTLPAAGYLLTWTLNGLQWERQDLARCRIGWALCLAACAVFVANSGHSAWHTQKVSPPDWALALRIKENLRPGETVYFWAGNAFSLPFLVGHRSASAYFTPLYVYGNSDLYNLAMPRLVSDIEKNRPALIGDCGGGVGYMFSNSMAAIGSTTPSAHGLDRAEWRDRLERLNHSYSPLFADERTRCVVYRRKE